MNFRRSGGILLHPTSLPGPYGIGDLGPQAYRFIDWLAAAGCRLWQVLPLGPTGYGDSPYQCFSAFAGNPYLISPDMLLQDGLLSEADLAEARAVFSTDPDADVDYSLVIPYKLSLLGSAFQTYQDSDPIGLREEFEEFRNRNAAWLNDYAFFMALKEENGGGSWINWPEPLRKRDEAALAAARLTLTPSILRYAFFQFLFFRQWRGLHAYAHHKDLTIIGDIPIFVAEDSSDVWAHPELFHLDEERRPTVVAGVPPDYFSPTGQLWGNPLYNWNEHKRTQYDWWLKRFQAILQTVDIVRLDHFRGFAGYWEIPAGNPTAEFGRWVQGPGADLFEVIRQSLKGSSESADLPIIAEDLGFITEDVVQLREQFRLPGMRILQFGFSGPDNPFLPHMYVKECVAYTGTHDNDTARGWFVSAPKAESRFALRYLHTTARTFAWDMIRAIWSSVAVFAVAPLQDLLDLGPEARMNYPSRLGGNWKWRVKESDINVSLAKKLRELNDLYLR
ncbi:MAG: 4-alpha-glucanotransferase [Anaerolineales bacterium]